MYCQRDTLLYNPDSTIILKGTLKNSKKIGFWFEYSKLSNKLLKKVEYFSGDSSHVIEYDYDSGFVKEKYSQHNVFIKPLIIGRYEMYHSNGKLARIGSFNKNGRGNGIWRCFYPNGKAQQVFYLQEGFMNGSYIFYYDNGIVKEIGKYKEDSRIAEWKEFHFNGKIKSKGIYCVGYKTISYSKSAIDSLIKINYDVSDLSFPITTYCKDGIWKYYDNRGKILKKEHWNKGAIVK